MITKIEGQCAWKGCGKPATHIAAPIELPTREKHRGNFKSPACYCKEHATKVGMSTNPEFVTWCPNCECFFGVN